MALQGSIKDFGLPDIFQLIGLQRKTGLLSLKHDDDTVTVTFENGMVVNADSSSKRIEDRLGNLLVKQGKLTEEKLEEVLQKQKDTLQRLGHILVANNYIGQKDLQTALSVQVSQNVFKLFRWKVGDYNFEPTEKVEFDRANFQPMSADFILMEGIRMVDEWPIIEKKIPSMDIVFRAEVNPSMIEVASGEDEAFGDSKKAASSKIRLSADEARVFRRVDGQRTVQAIIDAAGLADFDACKALYDLLSRDIIAPTGRTAKQEAGARETVASPALGYLLMAGTLVLALLGLLYQLGAPFGVLVPFKSPMLQQSLDLLLESVSRSRLERLDSAVVAYRYEHGALPKTLDEVAEEGLVDRAHLKDPWARPYHYGPNANGFVLAAVDDAGKPVTGAVIERAFPAARP